MQNTKCIKAAIGLFNLHFALRILHFHLNVRANSRIVYHVALEATFLDRMVTAVEKVRERLLRVSGALDAAQVS